jgi:carboxyl-terminal processing protease
MNDPQQIARGPGPEDMRHLGVPNAMNARRPVRRPLPLAALLALFAFAVLAAFAAGALMEREGWLPGAPPGPPTNLGRTFDPFWEAWRLVDEHYVDREAVDAEKMTQGSIRGMLDSLGDTGHTSYLSPKELERFDESIKGEFEGIGAYVSMRNHVPTIAGTLPDSPAKTAGLKPGDVLLKVDGEDVVELPLDRVVQRVRGPAGPEDRLLVGRKGAQPLEVKVTRAKVNLAAVSWRMLPGESVAHVAIHEFSKKTDDQLRAALKDARREGAKRLILDLRFNPGGLKDQAVAVASEFLADGVVFVEQDRQGKRKEVPVTGGGQATDVPLVVLIDEGTASAAEILAGAIQDYGENGRGELVGEKTFGTGTVLQPYELSDGGAILLAVSEWLTPKGRRIWHQGIKPTVEVPMPEGASVLAPETEEGMTAEELANSKDAQLLKALEVLKKKLP